jgi:hypothetical protein
MCRFVLDVNLTELGFVGELEDLPYFQQLVDLSYSKPAKYRSVSSCSC